MNRKRLFLLLLALPLVLIFGQFLYLQISLWQISPPRWEVDDSESYYGSCEGAAQMERYQAAYIDDPNTAVLVSREQARESSLHVLERYYDPSPVLFAYGPKLVVATFPDGKERTAWYHVMLVNSLTNMLGRGAVVYLDAQSGQPLLLIRDVHVGDPVMACGFAFILPMRLLLLILLTVYLAVVGIFGGLLWLVRRRRQARM